MFLIIAIQAFKFNETMCFYKGGSNREGICTVLPGVQQMVLEAVRLNYLFSYRQTTSILSLPLKSCYRMQVLKYAGGGLQGKLFGDTLKIN